MKSLYSILILIYLLCFNYIETNSKNDDDDDIMGPLSKYNFHTLFATDKTVTGPRCIPLTSKNIESNPYHFTLVSRKGAEVRRGIGKPLILEHPPLLCPMDSPSECIFNVEKSMSVTITNSISINIGRSNSLASSVGSTITRGQSNLFSRAIGKSIEKSLTNSITDSDEESVSDQLTKDLSKSYEKSSGITLGKSKENSQTITKSEENTISEAKSNEKTVSNTDTNEQTETKTDGGSKINSKSKSFEWNVHASYSASAEANLGIVKLSGTSTIGGGVGGSSSSSETSENNWQNSKSNSKSNSKTNSESNSKTDTFIISNGKSNAETESYSSSSSEENRASDSISYSIAIANSLVKGKSKSNSSSEGTSTGYNINDNYQATNETSIGNNINEEKTEIISTNIDNSTSFSKTLSVSSSQAYHVKPGECKILVCMPFVISAAVPYKCIGNNKELYEMYTEIMLFDNSTEIECVQSLIDCMNKNQMNTFMNTNIEFVNTKNPNYWNSRLDFGRNVEAVEDDLIIIKSSNSFYQFVQNSNGNLEIRNFEKIIWQNEMNYFNKSRIRINEKGHLIQESQNIFSLENYRKDEWITVWSSAPVNHNVTIGIPNLNGKSYVLVLSDSGILNLYDAVGAIIWCTDIGCQHRLGYKFPEVYLVPTLFLTPEEDNNHNSINKSIIKSNLTSFRSMDYFNTCTRLRSNEAIISNNGRFKLILEDSGNLIIKDDVRTMWESVSGFISHTVSPYYLQLTPMCQLRITSKNGYVVWISNSRSNEGGCFVDLNELDNGRLVVKDDKNLEIWQSWPTQNNNLGITFNRPVQYRYVPCDGKPYRNKQSLLINTQFNASQSLISQDTLWDFAFTKQKLVVRHLNVIKGTLCVTNGAIENVIFKSNGMLELNAKSLTYEYKYSESKDLKNSKVTITNDGDLLITNDLNKNVWELKLKDINSTISKNSFKIKHTKFAL
jgi:hypothetical protein